jgi:acetyl esterase/lipase
LRRAGRDPRSAFRRRVHATRVLPAGALAALLLALAAALLFAPAALAAEGLGSSGEGPPHEGTPSENGAGGTVDAARWNQLLLFHGGSFLYEDPTFEPLTRERALAAGFVPHYVTYPLDNLPAAVARAREEARRLREKYGRSRVFAYGSSAGGTLAALLAAEGLVEAGVAKAPVSDLATWEWPIARYGANYWEGLGVDMVQRERFSPALREFVSPLLVVQGRADQIVPPAMNEAFAAEHGRVALWRVAGGHWTDRARPYLVTRAMDWLARIAKRLQAAAR